MALSLDLSTSAALLAMSALDGMNFEGMAAADKTRLAELCRRLLPRLESEAAAAAVAVVAAAGGALPVALEGDSLLLSALRKDYGDHVFTFLAPPDAGRLECAFTSDLVFVEAGAGEALLLVVAGRRHAEAAKSGTTLVPLGDKRGERVTWARELLRINVAVTRVLVGGAATMLSVGRSGGHSLVTSGNAGETWSFGHGTYGMLGHGAGLAWTDLAVPRLIAALSSMAVLQVAASGCHSMALTSVGAVFSWGHGGAGRLGHGDELDRNAPKRVTSLANVTDIAVGASHNLAMQRGGAVYTWGWNRQGQLGQGDHSLGQGHAANRLVPTVLAVNGASDIVAVAAGELHSFALNSDGTIWVCGENAEGQLGLGDTAQRDTFTVVSDLTDVVGIDAGREHSVAVTAGGDVYTWGKGRATGHGEGGCLVPTKVSCGGLNEAMVVQVTAGGTHSMALSATGELFTWGRGTDGQLGHGEKEDLTVPRVVDGIGAVTGMDAGQSMSLVIVDGRVLSFGANGEYRYEDRETGEELDEDEYVFEEDGRLGLGMGLAEALTPTAIGGIILGGVGEGKEGKE